MPPTNLRSPMVVLLTQKVTMPAASRTRKAMREQAKAEESDDDKLEEPSSEGHADEAEHE